MPPRVRLRLNGLPLSNLPFQSTQTHLSRARPFSSTKPQCSPQPRRSSDKYTQSQKRAHAISLSSKNSAQILPPSDPVRGVSTPFVQSFDDPAGAFPPEKGHLKYSVTQEILDEQLEKSKELAYLVGSLSLETSQGAGDTAQAEQEAVRKIEEEHAQASEAIKRILSLEHGNARDKMRINTARCVDTFGRHNTDLHLPANDGGQRKSKERAGPDTGSSEVQIAILTSKIKNLADFIAGKGRKDTMNRRNLRLLVHRRQKLLRYLHRKERGGPRWQKCIQDLGLTDATWRGEITM